MTGKNSLPGQRGSVSSISRMQWAQFGDSRKNGDGAPTSTLCESLPVFTGMSSAERDRILSVARQKRVSRRETVFREGDSVGEILILLSGCLKLTQVSTGGKEVILRIIGRGQLVSGLQPSTNYKQDSTAHAVESSMVLIWDSAVFDGLLERFQVFRHNVIRDLEDQLRTMDCRFREVSTERVAARLSSELIRLSDELEGVLTRRKVHLSRTELAQLTGTTVSTVSRLLSRWQKLGLVSLDGGVLVEDPAALVRLCRDE